MSQIIRTSEADWLKKLAVAYKERAALLLVDDAHVGFDPRADNLIGMGRKAGASAQQWAGVAVALGISAVGIAMLVASWFDPEPTSKLGLWVGGGVVCVLTGGGTAVYILTKVRPPRVTASVRGFEISWE